MTPWLEEFCWAWEKLRNARACYDAEQESAFYLRKLQRREDDVYRSIRDAKQDQLSMVLDKLKGEEKIELGPDGAEK